MISGECVVLYIVLPMVIIPLLIVAFGVALYTKH